MTVLTFIAYFIVLALFVVSGYLVLKAIEYTMCIARGKIPFVPSAGCLRRALTNEIKAHYPNMKTACDIGAGYGGLARCMARECGLRVAALEYMPMTVAILSVLNFLYGRNVKTVWCDAFEHLARCDGFDLAVAYLGPGVNDRLADFADKFRVLITFDVPVEGLRPVRTIDIGHGFTRYGRKKFPHKLFVYEF